MAAARTLNVLVVHGVGWGNRGPNYARPLQDGIQHEFDRTIRRLGLRDVNRRDTQAKHALRFETAYWAPITQRPQNALLDVMFGRWHPLRRFSLTYHFRRNLVALLGDLVAYQHDPANNTIYRAIHDELDRCVRALSEASANETGTDERAPLTVIGHSLGSVIASDYVWDHTRGSVPAHHLNDYPLALVNFFTLGSPMALYTLRGNAYGGPESIRESLDSPITVDPDGGLWLNLYDRQDAVAFPLEPIKAYKSAGVIDRPVPAGNWLTGWNLLSHTGYWRCDDVARFTARKLALDWARLNSPDFAGRRYAKAVEALRKDLRQL
ncbi:MAG: hypothetical protein JXJ20_13555 [Anaerolineae bacterium]|nr:hypothetical protein [Anaerolineae bacterium]